MRKVTLSLISLVALIALSVPALASTTTHRVPVTHIVKVHVWRTVHGKRVERVIRRREVVRVRVKVRVKEHVRIHGKVRVEWRYVWRKEIKWKVIPAVTTTTTTTTTSPTKSTTVAATTSVASATTKTAAVATISVRASIDPTWTLGVSIPQSPPVPVTFSYSASDAGQAGIVADGSLSFNIRHHGAETSVGGCAANVGGTTTGSTCTVSVPAWGQYDLVTQYSGGVNVISTAGTEIVDIEPPALAAVTNADTWPAPTGSISILNTSSATASITSSNFEGATSVTLKDQLGDQCPATVSGTTASCTLPLTGAPTSLSVSYPGGASTTTTEYSSAWGVSEPQSVTTTWPAVNVSAGSTVNKASQTVSFMSAAPIPATGATYSPTASTTSSLTSTFSASGQCSGTTTVTMASTGGNCTVTATQAGNGYYSSASATQTFYVHTATANTTTYAISQIDAYTVVISGNYPSPCEPGGWACAVFGISGTGTPTQGTLTMTDTVTGASCTIDLASANVCYVRDTATSAQETYPNWKIKAAWGGSSSTDSNGNVTDYSAAAQTFTMQAASPSASTPPNGSTSQTGTWYDMSGTS